ncbi:MAG TPA: hypothetical protein DCW68_03195 [Rhodospirillaceae bacterium]|nr:MAG: hypothetical protein A2018_06170 [Alphaproteobacteria bacterium GWF2_58_20]HAU29098.1 hypothetical protein [Rhodospirillaceae bacterium]
MGLKFRLKPGERLAINGAVVRNPADRVLEIEVMNSAALLHEKDVMQPEQADNFMRRIYLYVQLMLLEPENRLAHGEAFEKMHALARHEAEMKSDGPSLALYEAVADLVRREDYFPALRQIQAVIGRPGFSRPPEN